MGKPPGSPKIAIIIGVIFVSTFAISVFAPICKAQASVWGLSFEIQKSCVDLSQTTPLSLQPKAIPIPITAGSVGNAVPPPSSTFSILGTWSYQGTTAAHKVDGTITFGIDNRYSMTVSTEGASVQDSGQYFLDANQNILSVTSSNSGQTVQYAIGYKQANSFSVSNTIQSFILTKTSS